MNEEKRFKKPFKQVINISLVVFLISSLISFCYIYLLGINPPTLVIYISITTLGIVLVSVLLERLFCLRDIDLDYFKNIMVGISGGIAVWLLTEIDFTFKDGFLLTINGALIKIGFSLVILLIGYGIYKNNSKLV